MPQLRFRNFSNLAFLQSIDSTRHLRRLLAPFGDYLSRNGIDVGTLTNDDACDRQLLGVFARPDGEMPGQLLEALHVLDEVADDAGHERILEEAKRYGISLGGLEDDLSPGDFAIAVYLGYPQLIRVCHEKTVCRKVKRYYESQSRDRRRLRVAEVQAKIATMRSMLAPWFDERKRTRTCEIFVYEEGSEIRLLVTHGSLYRTDGSITRKLERSRIGYWPQRHDSVIYDTRTGILKVHAQFVTERNVYRQTVGHALFDDPTYFQEGASYTLEGLRTNGGALAIVNGMEDTRLTEIRIALASENCREQIWKGHNLTEAVAGRSDLVVAPGEIIMASFAYTRGGRSRKIEVRLPNVADYDRDRDGTVVEAFLEANRFLAVEADRVANDELLEPA